MEFSFRRGEEVERQVTADTVHVQLSRFCSQKHFTALMVFPAGMEEVEYSAKTSFPT